MMRRLLPKEACAKRGLPSLTLTQCPCEHPCEGHLGVHGSGMAENKKSRQNLPASSLILAYCSATTIDPVVSSM